MKEVMVRAWEIARGAVVRFGGKVKEYFAQALAMAWKEVKEGVAVLKPSKFVVFDFVKRTKEAATAYHELNNARKTTQFGPAMQIKLEKAAVLASDLNKELKTMLALFTEEERNAMRAEFNSK
ncbi:hypothetical protein JI735_34195 (plasmid) [Paenibacillus sonchi]|uniref:Uncharacterized protein n=1 Tax=Paenibacillus sonchi TaxID=373687 RepID=A0A974PJ26_9BACL|nr:hypothetical protein [Paenibacillus sonchi]QQZ64493.1 hypothetical protein JI735_34195 [Paenibacillus sonchi]